MHLSLLLRWLCWPINDIAQRHAKLSLWSGICLLRNDFCTACFFAIQQDARAAGIWCGQFINYFPAYNLVGSKEKAPWFGLSALRQRSMMIDGLMWPLSSNWQVYRYGVHCRGGKRNDNYVAEEGRGNPSLPVCLYDSRKYDPKHYTIFV
jgi:hypothetical protein